MTTTSRIAPSIWTYVWLGIVAHIFIGSYPVFAKRALAEVPKFSLVFLASLAIAITGAAWMHWRERLPLKQAWHIYSKERILWLFAFVVALRAVTNIIAISLIPAVWMALLTMLAPFLVALLGAWLFSQPIPRFTFRALLISSVGAILMVVPDWSDVGGGFTHQDLLGVGIGLLSILAFSFYYLFIRRSRLGHATNGLVMFQQGLAMSTAFLFMTLATGEDWSQWSSVSTGGWMAVLIVIFVIQVGGNLLQIIAVGGVTPALITSFMGIRLVSALVLAGLILGEVLVSPTQWLGAILVVGAVTLYLWIQKNGHTPRPEPG